jgi:cobalt-zinc-cadmium efflux system membrane fusion protein
MCRQNIDRKNFADLVRGPLLLLVFCFLGAASQLGCGTAKSDPAAGAPPPAQAEQEQDLNVIQVDHPEQYPVVATTMRTATSQLQVTGVVTADVSRNVPVISLASGRVVDIHARLGDTVQKGQVLLTVRSDDVSSGYSDYRKAVADEALASAQLGRAADMYAHGAIALNDYQIAKDIEDKAKVDLDTTAEHLRLLGNDPDHPSGVVDIVAPVSGVITDQQVTNAGGVQALGSNPFTISDLSDVWVLCDVYENDLPSVRLGDSAEIRLNPYPDRVFKGTVSNIGAILDPNIRTAKVRIEVPNPGMIRLGMFVTATFQGQTRQTHAVVPAAAILHLHDRDWVFAPAANGRFQRVEITAGIMLPGKMQEVLSGIQPGARVVADALTLENTAEQ